jgi:hypothetical protein
LPLFAREQTLAKESGAEVPAWSETLRFASAELLRKEFANGKIVLHFYAPQPAMAVLSLPHAPVGEISVSGVTKNLHRYDSTNEKFIGCHCSTNASIRRGSTHARAHGGD